MIKKSIILNSDSYKYSQWVQYPEGTQFVSSYIESRGGAYDKVIFFGLQAFMREYLTAPITQADIERAEKIILKHGEPFNREGWEHILKEHGGHLPVRIEALLEGTVIDKKHVLVQIVNTDPKCYWLTSFLETALLRAIWYPTTVASNSYKSKGIIKKYMEQTGADLAGLSFKLHDFGARGASSWETAGLGGMAHLINFLGTDTVTGLEFAEAYYDADLTENGTGYSIPAMEHSTVTSWGRDREVDSYRNMLQNFAKPGALLAAVSDSYDIYNACKLWGTVLKDEVVKSGATVVVRPDSGDPSVVSVKCAEILAEHFGYTVNAKGFKVLNNVRIIYGDGINHVSINSILACLEIAGFSADNIAFGQGGALLQAIDRDTLKFAMKCSAANINGEWVDVYKDPVTDQGKQSKKGRLALVMTENGYETVREEDAADGANLLEVVYENGHIVKESTFAEVRARAA